MSVSQGDKFQQKVASLIMRNSNVMDILTKCHITCGKLCRSVVKSATGCGCTTIGCEKTLAAYTSDGDFSSHEMSGVDGALCSTCRSQVENEIGEMLFYIASLCNALDLNMNSIMKQEIKNVEVLGKYSLR